MIKSLLFIFIVIPTLSFGQPKLNEKFVNDSYNENNYLIFYPDSTFKYRLAYHLFHDISCGKYKTINDTIFLFYQSDLRDTVCNKEVDAATHFDSSLFALRPVKLFYNDNKLYKIEKGQIVDRTEKFEPDWGIPKSSRKYYHRKYWLFGHLVSNTKQTYYMVVASKAKWVKASS
ncbi:MAG: hypothetical protein K2X69_07030 [Silvanigrellaceae bacterium]|nr:hypothetical protein [Silvanigrellaceae bacterium]